VTLEFKKIFAVAEIPTTIIRERLKAAAQIKNEHRCIMVQTSCRLEVIVAEHLELLYAAIF